MGQKAQQLVLGRTRRDSRAGDKTRYSYAHSWTYTHTGIPHLQLAGRHIHEVQDQRRGNMGRALMSSSDREAGRDELAGGSLRLKGSNPLFYLMDLLMTLKSEISIGYDAGSHTMVAYAFK